MKKNFLSIDYTKPGKGVKKGQSKLFTLGNFFPLLKRKFWGLITTNFLWIMISFPLIFGLVALSGNFDFDYKAPADPLWAILSGVETMGGVDPALCALEGTAGIQLTMSYSGPVAKVLYALTALFFLTFGPSNTGMAYITRGYTKEEYVDMPSDFVVAIKKSFRQSIFLGLFDLIILTLIIFSLVFYATNYAYSFMFSIGLFISPILGIIYLMARPYLYLQLVTFKLPLRKIFKNAFIFSLVGIKRNVVGLLGSAAVIVLNLIIYIYLLPLGGLMPFFITISLTSFITTYAAWPTIKKIMIDPYYSTEEPDTPENDEPVFTDRG